jgi:hypothetical protein
LVGVGSVHCHSTLFVEHKARANTQAFPQDVPQTKALIREGALRDLSWERGAHFPLSDGES